ncbi:MAG: tetratricopeptide repeat protein, partial [Sandaracinaceae bacterium]|nr:tetratricopeptide repeat protein [Sandaracinaceae bacterium]
YLKQAERRRAYEEVLSSSELEMAEILNLSPSPSPSPLASMREQISKTLRKRIDGSKHSPSMPPPPPPSTMEAAPDRSSVLRQLVQSLITTSEQLGGLDQAERLLLQAKRLRAKGERAKALAAFRALLALRPEDPSIQAEVQALEHELGLELCQIFREQAIYEEKQEKWEAAARSWLQAIDAFRDDPQALWQSANALIEAGIELPLAKELAERAFELAPQDPRVLRTLARVHLRSGEISKAESLLLQAFRLDPSDLLTHQLLHKLRS